MQNLTETVIHSPLKNRIFTDRQLKHLLQGSACRRYGLVNRAMAAGEIVRISRGIYVLDNRFRDFPCHPFAVAQALVPLSYISFETALEQHGWIPESVQVIASAIPGRKKSSLDHPLFGSFSFSPLALVRQHYLDGVRRTQIDSQTFLLASPLRALFDLVCQRKIAWSGIKFLIDGLRIEKNNLDRLRYEDCLKFVDVYQHNRTRQFIGELTDELFPQRDTE